MPTGYHLRGTTPSDSEILCPFLLECAKGAAAKVFFEMNDRRAMKKL